MGVFSIFRKKPNSNDLELVVPVEPAKKELVINSNEILPLSNNNVIDTTSEEVIAKYKSNVRLLRNKYKELGNPGDLVIIRNDDLLPDDFMWHENSAATNGEFNNIALSNELRVAIAQERVGKKFESNTSFAIPGMYDEDKISEELKKLRGVGNIFAPVKFRTTKHFTINTPLGYTGNYNLVKADRKYTIIDDANGLIASPYTYSISGHDAYLDVTHESFNVSNNAIILISEDYFNEIKDDKELMAILSQRRLMVYKGNIDIAINMILSENGILPFRPGLGIPFDYDMENIIETDLKQIASDHDYSYDIGHGNLFGKGGHFSDLIDTRYNLEFNYLQSFVDYLNLNANLSYEITLSMVNDPVLAKKLVKDIGTSRLLEIINAYNIYMIDLMKQRRAQYASQKREITEEERELFSSTVRNIDNLFRQTKGFDDPLWEYIYKFYTSIDISEQVAMASCVNEEIKNYGNNIR